MLRSDYCSLHEQDDMQLQDLGECPYDQVHLATCCALHAVPCRARLCLSDSAESSACYVETLISASCLLVHLPAKHVPPN